MQGKCIWSRAAWSKCATASGLQAGKHQMSAQVQSTPPHHPNRPPTPPPYYTRPYIVVRIRDTKKNTIAIAIELSKLHRHRPQIEKISETLFHAASIGQWYSGCLDKQISQHLLTQLTWANILWKRVLSCWMIKMMMRLDSKICVSDWHHRGCVKKNVFSLPPTISNLGTLKSHLKAILVPNDSSNSGNFHASALLGFA